MTRIARVGRHIAVALALPTLGARVAPAQNPSQSNEARIDTIVVRQMRARRIPGVSIAVVRDGKLAYAKGYGEANLEWKAAATAETVYLIASATKQFTATAVMMLVNEGRVRLDDSISKYLASTSAAWRGITIRQLLAHTAGLKDRFEQSADGRLYMDYSTAQMLDAAAKTPADFAPGARWQYSDQGYFLLGAVIERASGVTYAQFLRDRIFAPLGMTSTSVHDWSAIVPNRADGYALAGDQLVGSRRRYQFGVVSHYGVQSTVLDLVRYDSALTAGALVPAAKLAEMWTPAKLGDGRGVEVSGIGYGYGWFLERFNGHRLVYHAGSTGTCIFKLPDDGVSVVVLTNLEQVSGSDPCFMARGIATRYVPAVAIVETPPIADRDTALTRRLRDVAEGMARGIADSTNFVAEYFALLRPGVAAQAAGLSRLGPLSTFDLIADDTLVSRVRYYRARYRDAVVHFKYVLEANGRISAMSGR